MTPNNSVVNHLIFNLAPLSGQNIPIIMIEFPCNVDIDIRGHQRTNFNVVDEPDMPDITVVNCTSNTQRKAY